jgi:outer membrane lipoprotein-sorting protein
MKRVVLLACALVAMPGLAPVLAQTPTIDDLLARNVASRGGAEKLKAITTRKVTGKVVVRVQAPGMGQQGQSAPPTVEMPMEVIAKRPNLMRQEVRMQETRIVTAFDGQQAWAQNPMVGPSPQLLQGPQADIMRDQAQFDGPLAYARQRGDKMEVLGKEQVEGASTWKIAISREGRTTTVYLDETTALERKISASISQGGSQMVVESLISDYQPIDGIMVPRQVQTVIGGQTQATVTIDDVEFNVPIDDAQFKMPAANR